MFVLSNIDQFGVYEWIGSNYESIKTKDGLIIETKGLRSDIKFYSYDISILEKELNSQKNFMKLKHQVVLR